MTVLGRALDRMQTSTGREALQRDPSEQPDGNS
jgi:hypothetical protein